MTRPSYTWQLRSRALSLGSRTLLMGIVNVTPDSFSDGGRFLSESAALDRALQLLDEGADLVDVGGESTRPGATPVSAHEEQARVLPVVRAILRARPGAIVSLDTYRAATAEAALDAGAEVVNDVSGLMWDAGMAAVLAAGRPGAVLMHTRGEPRSWRTLPELGPGEVLPLVIAGLRDTLAIAAGAGIAPTSVVLDPGFGFGKLGAVNFELLARLKVLQQLGMPLLAGVSRKGFLTGGLERSSPSARTQATTAANVAAIRNGAHILRVHDVAEAVAAAAVADAISNFE